MEHKNKKIKQFWDWFSENCEKFGKGFENTPVVTELDNWINNLGNYSWEIGPGKTKENALVISPNGDIKLLENTKEIITHAKDCPGWEFYYAKPSKEWNLEFEFDRDGGSVVIVNALKWKYILLQYDDGMCGIIIRTEHLTQLSDEEKLTAAEIVLDGILGEERRMLLIDEIDVVEEFEESDKKNASNISDLTNHLLSLD